jgi:hypothetical protein
MRESRTYVYRHLERAAPTDEWRRITEEDAINIAKHARLLKENSYRPTRTKKQKSSDGKRTTTQCGKRTENPGFYSAETATTSHSAETVTTLDTLGVVVGDAAGNLVREVGQAVSSDPANGSLPDPWADLEIPEALRRY